MRDLQNGGKFEQEVREAFRALVAEALPAAAAARGWPVAAAPDFERLLLDHACGAPWDGPAGCGAARTSLLELVLAVETGARLLDGGACVAELSRRSLDLRAAACAAPCALAPREDDQALCDREVRDLMRRAITAAARRRRGRRPAG